MKRLNIYHRHDGRWEGRISRGKKNGKRKFQYVLARTKTPQIKWRHSAISLTRSAMNLNALLSIVITIQKARRAVKEVWTELRVREFLPAILTRCLI